MPCCGWDTSEDGSGLLSEPLLSDNFAYLVDREGKYCLDNQGRYIIFEATESGYSFFDLHNQTLPLLFVEPTERIQILGLSLTTDEICIVEFLSNVTSQYKYYSGGNGNGIALSDEQDLWTGGYGESLSIAVSGTGKVSGRIAMRVKSW